MSSDVATMLLTRSGPISRLGFAVVVSIDGKAVARLAHGESTTVPVTLGPHRVNARCLYWRAQSLAIEVRSPRRTFIDVSLPGMSRFYRALWPFSAIRLAPDPALMSDEPGPIRSRRAGVRSARGKAGLSAWAATVERKRQT